jgi:hypothetical protein
VHISDTRIEFGDIGFKTGNDCELDRPGNRYEELDSSYSIDRITGIMEYGLMKFSKRDIYQCRKFTGTAF